MSPRIASTSWPSAKVPKATQELLDYFFSLMDTNSDEAGLKLIGDIFTPEATFISSSGVFKGAAGWLPVEAHIRPIHLKSNTHQD